MKAYAHYDTEGAIHMLIIGEAPDGVQVRMTPQAGMNFGEVKGVTVQDVRNEQELRRISQTHRVKVSRAVATVVKDRQ